MRLNFLYYYLSEDCFFKNKALSGHSASCWVNRLNAFGKYFLNGYCVFSFPKLVLYLKKALNFLFRLFFDNRTVTSFFSNGVPFFNFLLKNNSNFERLFQRCLSNYVLRWVPGLFSNMTFVLRNYRKKTRTLQKRFGINNGLKLYVKIPSVVVFFSSAYYFGWSINEVNRSFIPTIGIVDSNSYYGFLSFPVFGNDDTVKSLLFYLKIFVEAIIRGILNCLFVEEFVFTTLNVKIINFLEQKKKKRTLKEEFVFRFGNVKRSRVHAVLKKSLWSVNEVFLRRLVQKNIGFKYRSKFLKFLNYFRSVLLFNTKFYGGFLYKILFYLKLLLLGFNFRFYYSILKYLFLLKVFYKNLQKFKKNLYILRNILIIKYFFFVYSRACPAFSLLGKIYNKKLTSFFCSWYTQSASN